MVTKNSGELVKMNSILALIVVLFVSLAATSDGLKSCDHLNPIKYNPKTQDCRDSKIIPLTTTTPAPPTTTTTPWTQFITCNGHVYTSDSRNGRMECCGHRSYHPDNETCCPQTVSHVRVFSNAPEKDYVCCRSDLKLFKRGAKKISCVHPSVNDRLWGRKMKLKESSANKDMCTNYKYAFIIKVGKDKVKKMAYSVSVTKKSMDGEPVPKSRKRMWLKYDKYRPVKRLNNKRRYLMLSADYDWFDEKEIYTKPDNPLFSLPLKQYKKALKRFFRQCENIQRS